MQLAATIAPPRIPDYDLIRLIGRGSYGDVWLARGLTGLYWAVKIVWRDRCGEFEAFDREFRGLKEFAAVSLKEPHQLTLLHIGRSPDARFFYYVMELADDVSGAPIEPETYVPHTLAQFRKRHVRMPVAQAIVLGVDLARALAGLHTRGLVHRDVKPSNVVFVGGVPKLADVGLVSAAASARTFVGTEGFVPPEGPGTTAADVFSLGKLLYETATGLDRYDYPRLPPNLNEWPDRKELLELNEVLIRACAPRVEQRYRDAGAMLDDLLLLQAGRSMRRLRATEQRLARVVRVAIALTLVAGIAGAGVWIERTLRRQAESERDALVRKMVYTGGLAKAQHALGVGNLGAARHELEQLIPAAGAPDLRGFEWHALRNEAQGSPVTVLRPEGSVGEAVQFSPDGRWLVASSTDWQVTLWDTTAWKVVRELRGISYAGFSADSQWLLGIDPKVGLQRWSIATGEPGDKPIAGVERPFFSSKPFGELSVTLNGTHKPHVLHVWDVVAGREARRILIPSIKDDQVRSLYGGIISDNQKFAAILVVSNYALGPRALPSRLKAIQFSSRQRRVGVYDLERGEKIAEEAVINFTFIPLALSPDGGLLAATSRDSAALTLHRTRDHALLWKVNFDNNGIGTACFSPDGQRLAVGSGNNIWLIDTATGETLNKRAGHNGRVMRLAWDPDGRALASVGVSGEVFFWRDLTNPTWGTLKTTQISSEDFYRTAVPSPDGRWLVVSRAEFNFDLISAGNLQTQATFKGINRFVSFSADGKELVLLTQEGGLQRWSVEAPSRLLGESKDFSDLSIYSIQMARDDSLLAMTDLRGRLFIWDRVAGRMIDGLQVDLINSMQISSDSNYILTASSKEAYIRIWESRTGVLFRKLPVRVAPNSWTFDPHRRWVALGFMDGTIEVRRWPDLELARRWNIGTGVATALEVTPQGDRLLCGSSTGALHFFSTADWSEITTFPASDSQKGSNRLLQVTFSADGRMLVACFAGGHVRIWRR